MAPASVASGNKRNKQSPSIASVSEKIDPFHNKKDLFFPKNRVSYFVYKPFPPNSSIHRRLFNCLQLVYYKYQLTTGIYMMNEKERMLVNFLVLSSIVLTFYHFIL